MPNNNYRVILNGKVLDTFRMGSDASRARDRVAGSSMQHRTPDGDWEDVS